MHRILFRTCGIQARTEIQSFCAEGIVRILTYIRSRKYVYLSEFFTNAKFQICMEFDTYVLEMYIIINIRSIIILYL